VKVVWSPLIRELKLNPPYYKNVWFIPSDHEVWLEPHRFDSVKAAMEACEDADCIRVAILELQD
jgi:hypothetical protein